MEREVLLYINSLSHCREKEIDSSYNPGEEPDLYAFWAVSVIGPIVYIVAVLHAVLWSYPGSICGSIVSTHTHTHTHTRILDSSNETRATQVTLARINPLFYTV